MSSDSDSDSDLSRKFGNDSSGDEKEVKKEDKKDTTPQVQNSMLQQSAHIENPPNNIPQISMIETTESKVPEQSNQTSSLMKNDISNIKPKEEDDNGKKENPSDMSIRLDSLNFSQKSQKAPEVNSNPFFTKKDNNQNEQRGFGHSNNNNNEPKEFKEFDDRNDDRNDRGGRQYNNGFGRGNDRRNDNFGSRNYRGGDRREGFGFGQRRGYRGGYRGGFDRNNDDRRGFNRNGDYNRNDLHSNPNSHFNSRPQEIPYDKDPFYINHKSLILDIKDLYNVEEKEILKILKVISNNSSRTVFEVMNEIRRECTIILHLPKLRTNTTEYDDRRDIYETPYSKDSNQETEDILNYYKVYKEGDVTKIDLPTDFLAHEKDSRRKLQKDSQGLYNYIPKFPPYVEMDKTSNANELYAKNLNEINYHSLMYKTFVCRKTPCTDKYCPYAHGMEDDFRLIYEYQNEKICKLMVQLVNTPSLHIEDYLKHFEIPNTFLLSNFKIHKCQLNPTCNYDRHLCLLYHNEEEKRRPPLLFRYNNQNCRYAQEEEGAPFKPDLCPYEIFCPNIHSIGEYQYHVGNFRKTFTCTRKKINGRCIFEQTCYGIHDKQNDSGDDSMMSKTKANPYEKKFKEKEEQLNRYICPVCKSLPKDKKYCLVIQCSHLMCLKCLKKGKNKETKELICPICKKPIPSKGVVKFSFEKEEDEE